MQHGRCVPDGAADWAAVCVCASMAIVYAVQGIVLCPISTVHADAYVYHVEWV